MASSNTAFLNKNPNTRCCYRFERWPLSGGSGGLLCLVSLLGNGGKRLSRLRAVDGFIFEDNETHAESFQQLIWFVPAAF